MKNSLLRTSQTFLSKAVSGDVNIVSIGDIHLFHNKTSTESIVESLDMLIDSDYFRKAHIVSINGDMFDTGVPFKDPRAKPVIALITKMLVVASECKIILRILEGTPDHDHGQSIWFEIIKESLGIEVDVRYVNKLDIEYLPTINKTILYIPDEHAYDSDTTYNDVLDLMAEKGLSKVDLISMHGYFEYQAPNGIISRSAHKEAKYIKICSGVIMINHIHVKSQYRNILAPGSWATVRHGEHEKKGCHFIQLHPDNTFDCTIIENPSYIKYHDLDIRGKGHISFEGIKALINFKYGSAIRLICDESQYAYYPERSLNENIPGFIWSRKDLDRSKTEVEEDAVMVDVNYVPPVITPENIITILREVMVSTGREDNGELEHLKSLIGGN